MTARSVLLSVLLGTDPPRLPVAVLVSTTELFGISEGTTRTALSRMAAKGEVRADDGHYEIASARLLRRQERQDRSRIGASRAWSPDEGWLQAVVVQTGPRPADERADLRRGLLDARLAELRDGVWMRPANLDVPPAVREHEALLWSTTHPDTDPTDLAEHLWDLTTWAEVADRLLIDVDALVPSLEAGAHGALADGFVVSAAVLRHLQADPLLPDALLPRDWPGAELRDRYGRFDSAYRHLLREWFDAHPALRR